MVPKLGVRLAQGLTDSPQSLIDFLQFEPDATIVLFAALLVLVQRWRYSLKHVDDKERKKVTTDWREGYTAKAKEATQAALEKYV